jgi:hypothetical protein
MGAESGSFQLDTVSCWEGGKDRTAWVLLWKLRCDDTHAMTEYNTFTTIRLLHHDSCWH